MKILTITSDMGDLYSSLLKGIVLNITDNIQILDITNSIPRWAKRAGALCLLSALNHFPHSVHLGVVGPLPQTKKVLCIRTEKGLIVGPDNGLLIPLLSVCGGEVYEIRIDKRMVNDEGGCSGVEYGIGAGVVLS